MQFRLIVDDAADGAHNMAVDEALLDSAMGTSGIPTLRLYRFDRPTITFGYGQDFATAVDRDACRTSGVECIRRITGGRALIHQHELTYSVTAPPVMGSVRGAYQSVTGAIRTALDRLGVPIDAPGTRHGERAPAHLPCLAVPTGHEIMSGGNKLVASAMRFRMRGFLQHGSILWAVDRSLWRRIMRLDASQELPAVGVRELNAPGFGESELVHELSRSFQELFGSRAPIRAALSPAEASRASELREKYRSRAWNERLEKAEIESG